MGQQISIAIRFSFAYSEDGLSRERRRRTPGQQQESDGTSGETQNGLHPEKQLFSPVP
jgi:hypothetical protein